MELYSSVRISTYIIRTYILHEVLNSNADYDAIDSEIICILINSFSVSYSMDTNWSIWDLRQNQEYFPLNKITLAYTSTGMRIYSTSKSAHEENLTVDRELT